MIILSIHESCVTAGSTVMPIIITQKKSKIAACEEEVFEPKTYSKAFLMIRFEITSDETVGTYKKL